MKRRDFLKTLGALAGGAVAARARGRAPSSLPRRALGATGPQVPILGVGGSHLGQAESEAEAHALVQEAYESGVRFFDNAESYQRGRAERWMGAALKGIREHVLLMTKTHEPGTRSAESAKRHLEGSLERLQTDYLDLWQLHSVKSPADVDRAFARGGAMELILRMKEQGVVKHVGVTGHVHPEANRRALWHFDQGMRFDCMQLPLNPIDFHQVSFQKDVLPALVERDVGVIAMKTAGGGALVERGVCTIDECLRYVWSLPTSVIVSGMSNRRHLRHNLAAARAFEPMSAAEMGALRRRIAPRAELGLEWYKRA